MLFLKRLLSGSSHKPRRVPATIPEGKVVWAIGDIHGRLDLLNPLIDYIAADIRNNVQGGSLVFLGDYVDRGPRSREVIERLYLLSQTDLDLHFIRGNHEDRMYAFLTEPEVGQGWCKHGGRETLSSFDLRTPILKHRPEEWRLLSFDLAHALTDEHKHFFSLLKPSVTIGGYFFTHAGARPGKSLDDQSEQDLMWVRDTFLNHPTPFECVVVHGHTPAPTIHSDDRRIGLDTGAYKSGRLSAVRLQGGARSFVECVRVGKGKAAVRPVTYTEPATAQRPQP